MEEELITKVMQEVMKRVGNGHGNGGVAVAEEPVNLPPRLANVPAEVCQLTEFVGVGMGDTEAS